MCLIQRESSQKLLSFVRNHPYFIFMHEGLDSGTILPCLRKKEMHFYECGARLFNFSDTSVSTHTRYLSEHGKGYRTIRKNELETRKFNNIREAAGFHRKRAQSRTHDNDGASATKFKTSELALVHTLFPAFSVTRSGYEPGDLALVDVEARFGKDGDNLAGGMIDLVFLMPDRRLLFVEAKGIWHTAVQSKTTAKVETQVKTYEAHIQDACVVEALNRSTSAQAAILDRTIPFATGVFPRVPVLLLGLDDYETQIGPNNLWLRARLDEAEAWTEKFNQPRVINGKGSPEAAIIEFAKKIGSA